MVAPHDLAVRRSTTTDPAEFHMSWHGMPVATTDRADWLAKRKEGIGASDVAGILGLSTWATPFTVWADKTKDLEDDPNESMYWGKVLEDVVVDEFEQRIGLHVHGRQWLVHHPDHPWVMCTIDGWAEESPVEDEDDWNLHSVDPLALVEVKTDAGFGAWNDGPPDHVRIQCLWQMFTTGVHTLTYVPTLHGGRRFEIYEVEWDEGLAEKIFLRVSEWRDRFILGGETPEPDESPATTKLIGDLWDVDEGVSIELSSHMAADLEALRGWKREKAAAEKEVKRLENRLKVALQEAEVGTVAGEPMVTWKSQHRDAYTVEASDFRVLRLKKQKEST